MNGEDFGIPISESIKERDEKFKREILAAAREHGYVVKLAYPFCNSFYVELASGKELVAGHWDVENDRYGRCIDCGWNMHRLPWSES